MMKTMLFAVAVTAAAAISQSVPYTTATPRVFTGDFAGSGNLFPFARSGGLIQYWWRGDCFSPGQVVASIGGRPMKNLNSSAQTLATVEIKFANSPLGFAGLSKTFAANLPAATTTIFTAKPVSLPAVTAASDPNRPMLWLACDVPFVVIGPNVIGQFDMGPATGAFTLTHNTDAFSMGSAGSAMHTNTGTSCGGSLNGSPTTTTAYNLQLAGADASKPAILLIGASHTEFGALKLPLKLDAFGFAGCWLGVAPLVTAAVTTDATGGYFMSTPIATPPADSIVLYAQALHSYAANASGWATTNVVRSILGGAGYANYLYNFTIDGPTAQYGPYTTNRGPVLLFKP